MHKTERSRLGVRRLTGNYLQTRYIIYRKGISWFVSWKGTGICVRLSRRANQNISESCPRECFVDVTHGKQKVK